MKLQAIMLLIVTLLLGSLMAEPPRRNMGGHGKGDGTRMAQELGLSQEQQDQLKELRKKHREERRDIRTEVKELRRQIGEELKKSNPSRSTIKSLADKIGTIHSENAVRMADHMLEVKEILTDEQFTKMLDLKEEKANKMHKKKGPGGKKGQGGHRKGGACCPKS